MDGNDIEGTIDKYKDMDNPYVYTSGVFQAMTSMDNDTFKRSIKAIEKMEECLKS
tara:strand:+ start:182 stop:346 length:165 start_codon:yes stop_codon:yes gene_type:complete